MNSINTDLILTLNIIDVINEMFEKDKNNGFLLHVNLELDKIMQHVLENDTPDDNVIFFNTCHEIQNLLSDLLPCVDQDKLTTIMINDWNHNNDNFQVSRASMMRHKFYINSIYMILYAFKVIPNTRYTENNQIAKKIQQLILYRIWNGLIFKHLRGNPEKLLEKMGVYFNNKFENNSQIDEFYLKNINNIVAEKYFSDVARDPKLSYRLISEPYNQIEELLIWLK